ncbi:MAG: helix-turn-helix domain-containing protein [Erysipelotrichaceae bacterium]|nr:helix-turn-helix domain-containing protein [Erysipelotrichaceae bacterium]
MMIDKSKQLFRKEIEILHALLNDQQSISGMSLFKKTGFSIKTIRNSIEKINDYANDLGFQIVSKSRVGYEIEVNDLEKFIIFTEYFLRMYHRNIYFHDNQDERVHFIIRRLLTNRFNIYLDDLADECYVSKSMIDRDMVLVKQLLRKFELDLINHTNNGLSLEGNEWHIRLLLIYEHRIFNSFARNAFLDNEDDFRKLFFPNGQIELYEYIRNVILIVLKENDVLLRFGNLAKLINMTLLTISRKERSKDLYIENDTLYKHRHTKGYDVAIIIFDRIYHEHGYFVDENSLLVYAAYMNCNITYKNEELKIFSFYHQISHVINKFLAHLKFYIDYDDETTTVISNDLISALASYQMCTELNVLYKQEFTENYRRDGLLSADICVVFYKFLKANGYRKFTIDEALSFYNIFAKFVIYLQKRNVINVIVVSRYGDVYSEILCDRLRNLDSIFTIRYYAFEFTQLTNIDQEKYDFLITDLKKEQMPSLNIETLYLFDHRKKSDLLALIRRLCTPRSLLNSVDIFSDAIIYVDGVNDIKGLYAYIKQKILSECVNVDEFIIDVIKKNEILSINRKNQFMIMKTCDDILKEDIFKILVLAKPIIYNNEPQSYIVIYNIKDNRAYEQMFINNLISELIHKEKLDFFDEDKRLMSLDMILR